ncbi:protein transporter [Clavulina sp. PMI_390]|nr:protein transporter [Clavulina sp. PMI_390]
MSAPKIIVQVIVTGSQIFGKALLEAGRQAVKNAKYRPAEEQVGSAAGMANATSGSPTDMLTRQHRMTYDEALLILNLKRGESSAEKIKSSYDHLFKANSPPVLDPPPPKSAPPMNSHYLQSKVVRAKERIDAELLIAQQEAATEAGSASSAEGPSSSSSGSSGTPPPPPPSS